MITTPPGAWRRVMRIGWTIIAVAVVAVVAYYGTRIVSDTLYVRRTSTCALHMTNLGRAILTYSDEYGGALPFAEHWCYLVLPYVRGRSEFVCPAAHNRNCSYALNTAVSGLRRVDIENAEDLVLLFESDAGWNAAGGPELLPALPRHHGGERVFYVGGSGGWQARLHAKGPGDSTSVTRSYYHVRPEEWLKGYAGITRPVEWTPVLSSAR
jgi:hypothetical protein